MEKRTIGGPTPKRLFEAFKQIPLGRNQKHQQKGDMGILFLHAWDDLTLKPNMMRLKVGFTFEINISSDENLSHEVTKRKLPRVMCKINIGSSI